MCTTELHREKKSGLNEAPKESVKKLFASARIRLMSLASQVPEYDVAPVAFTRLRQHNPVTDRIIKRHSNATRNPKKVNLSDSLAVYYPNQWTRESQE